MDRLLQLLIDFKTPLDRSGKNIDDYLSALFEKYIEIFVWLVMCNLIRFWERKRVV